MNNDKRSFSIVIELVKGGECGQDLKDLLIEEFDETCTIRLYDFEKDWVDDLPRRPEHSKERKREVMEEYKDDKLYIVTGKGFKNALVYVLRMRNDFKFVYHAWLQNIIIHK